MTPHVLLVRHAESVPPRPDGPGEYARPLTQRGHAQAAALVPELAAYRPVRFVSSPYARAVATVFPAARALGLEVEADEALREWDSGLGPRAGWADHYRASWADPASARPGGESLAALGGRAAAALAALARGPVPVVVGSHGTFVARALVAFGHAVDADFWLGMPMPAVYLLRWTAGGVEAAGPGLPG